MIELTVVRLQEGTALHSLVHAVVISKWPDFENEVSWEGSNYSRQNTQGAYGTVSVAGDDVVAAFYDSEVKECGLDQCFAGCPSPLRALAEREALQYLLLDEENPKRPVVSAALWSIKGRLKGARPWEALCAGGAHLIEGELLPEDEAIIRWANDADLESAQVDTLRSIWTRWRRGADLVLTRMETKALGLLDLEDRTVALGPRQGMMVPRTVVHRTRAPRRTVVLMIEAATVVPTGDERESCQLDAEGGEGLGGGSEGLSPWEPETD